MDPTKWSKVIVLPKNEEKLINAPVNTMDPHTNDILYCHLRKREREKKMFEQKYNGDIGVSSSTKQHSSGVLF